MSVPYARKLEDVIIALWKCMDSEGVELLKKEFPDVDQFCRDLWDAREGRHPRGG